ncbi:trypsin-like serine protease [Streptomyces sp. NEAU-W12]|uniref:trypsin-like serine protease n=1 Tax=Streptomyces sp. NEAU-W12 TaxID=2994668 RepID=UPI00224ABB2F|nr:trypsin-like serine protease [Streptomyces sp. NEAU-W12]MCX2926977.1 trypsin-like serine protease [Streptomyces sp. NEAU-W12]
MRHPRRHRLTTLTTSLAAALLAAPLALTSTPATAVSGPASSDDSLLFTARLDIGDGQRACSGALIDRDWLLTAASCFADDPAESLALPAGAPRLKTTATIGRTDLTTTAGETRTIVDLVPYSSRDVVLARLSRPVTTVTPVGISAAAAAAGEELTVAGYGRTRTEWSPLNLHSGTFTVDSVAADTVGITGKDGASVCMGDTGGPAVRMVGGKPELVALSSRSWQGGCFGIDPAVTQTGAVSARVDDLHEWVTTTVAVPRVTDYTGDGKSDVAYLYDYGTNTDGTSRTGLWLQTSTGSGFDAPVKPWDSGTGSWTWNRSKLVSGDFNGDGLADVGVLYKYANTSDGRGHSALWTFTSTGTGFNAPVKVWDSGTGSWTWDNSKLVSGDFNGDGLADVGVLYKYANTSDGRGHSALWTFTSTGTDFNTPAKKWDSGTGSWTWDNSKLVSGDFNGDGKSDVGVLYKYPNTSDGRGHSALWTFTSTGTDFNTPAKKWDSGTGSWTWDRTEIA